MSYSCLTQIYKGDQSAIIVAEHPSSCFFYHFFIGSLLFINPHIIVVDTIPLEHCILFNLSYRHRLLVNTRIMGPTLASTMAKHRPKANVETFANLQDHISVEKTMSTPRVITPLIPSDHCEGGPSLHHLNRGIKEAFPLKRNVGDPVE